MNFFKKGRKVASADDYKKREEEAAKSDFDGVSWKDSAIELNFGEEIGLRIIGAAFEGEDFDEELCNYHHFVEHKSCYAVGGFVDGHNPRYYSTKTNIKTSGTEPPARAFKKVWDKWGKDSVQLTQFQEVLALRAHRMYWVQVVESKLEKYPVGSIFRFACPRDKEKKYWMSQLLDGAANQKLNSYDPYETYAVHPLTIACTKGDHGRDFSTSKIEYQLPMLGYLVSKEIVEKVGGKFVPYVDYNKTTFEEYHNVVLTDKLDDKAWEWLAMQEFMKQLYANEAITLVPKNGEELETYVVDLCETIKDLSFFKVDEGEDIGDDSASAYLDEDKKTDATTTAATTTTDDDDTGDDLPF